MILASDALKTLEIATYSHRYVVRGGLIDQRAEPQQYISRGLGRKQSSLESRGSV